MENMAEQAEQAKPGEVATPSTATEQASAAKEKAEAVIESGDAGDGAAADATGGELPEGLGLSFFLEQKALSDCSVRVIGSAGGLREIPCHRLALSSASGYFFRVFQRDETGTVVDLPHVPEDDEVRSAVDMPVLFPLVLRYIYNSQSWEALQSASALSEDTVLGLFVLSVLLEMKSLTQQACNHIDAIFQREPPGKAAKLLYLADCLRDAFAGASAATSFAKAPPAAASQLSASIQAAAAAAAAAAGAAAVEALGGGAAAMALATRAASDAALATFAAAATTAAEPTMVHVLDDVIERCCRALKAGFTIVCQASEDVRLLGRLPVSVLAQLLEADDLNVPAESAVLRLVRSVLEMRSAAPQAAVASSSKALVTKGDGEGKAEGDADGKKESEAEGETEAEAVARDASVVGPLTEEETVRLLAVVRFTHLEHQELLMASVDPILTGVPSVQRRILEAMSARLSQYETTGNKLATEEPRRHSTRPGAVARGGGFAAAAARGRGPAAQKRSGSRPATATAMSLNAILPPSVAWGTTKTALANGNATILAAPGGVRCGGAALFPCSVCGGNGQLLLKQRDEQWIAQCSRHPGCHNTVWLPRCVAAAAVDGCCANCTLRYKFEVRTLTVRVEMRQAVAVLPAGVDILRGVCLAGCSDSLGRLGP